MADNQPTLHHLNNSQSQRILWLIEELGIDYHLVLHTRNGPSHPSAPFRSPPSLQSTGSGKAPVLITGAADGNRVVPESLAIANYLIRTFDKEDRFGMRNGDWVRDDVLTSVCMTGLGRATGFKLYMDLGFIQNREGAPAVADGPELRMVLKGLEKELAEGPFFMGKEPGRADVMLEFPMSFIKMAHWVELEEEFPELNAWLWKVYDRPAWKRGLEKGFDGVYDMGVFPKTERTVKM